MRVRSHASDQLKVQTKLVFIGKKLKPMYPNLMHITCLAHSCYCACEYVRNQFRDVDRFIALMKCAFLKCIARVQVFREVAPGVPLPPAPVITRWGTWLEAVVYYSTYWTQVLEVGNFENV